MNFITKTDFNISDTGEATYKVQIRDFHLRMKNWPVGKVIQSEFFEIQDFLLHLEIFPNGQKDADKDCVSAFLHNDSKNACFMHFKINIGNEEGLQFKKQFKPMESWGGEKICNHAINYPNFKADQDLLITCEVMLLTTNKVVWDMHLISEDHKARLAETNVRLIETKRKHDKTNASLIEAHTKLNETNAKLDSTNTKLQLANSSLEETKAKFAKLENKFDSRFAKMESTLEDLPVFKKTAFKLKKPPCPICCEDMSHETKIAQCINGHHVCWTCKEKMIRKKCSMCGLPLDGRAFSMETYLKSLFDE